jgi:hypothetical protein
MEPKVVQVDDGWYVVYETEEGALMFFCEAKEQALLIANTPAFRVSRAEAE